MNAIELYETWAPAESPWSVWVKPVLFAHVDNLALPPALPPGAEWGWEPPAPVGTALLIDLPGLQAVGMGLLAAERGYRPVPVFNACPAPVAAQEVVPVSPILAAIEGASEKLRQLNLPADAPPALLIDSERGSATRPIVPGVFDNRSVVFATDFPSANFLLSRGIERVVVVRRERLGDDLVEVLLDYQRGGLQLLDDHRDRVAPAGELKLPSASMRWLTRVTRQVVVTFLFRHALTGGFGGFVPEASSSG